MACEPSAGLPFDPASAPPSVPAGGAEPGNPTGVQGVSLPGPVSDGASQSAPAAGQGAVIHSPVRPDFFDDVGAEGTLRAAGSKRGILVGAAVGMQALMTDPHYRKLLAEQFSYVTPENRMKWGLVQPNPTTWSLGQADEIVAQAEAAGQRVKGHALVWHRELPWWVDEDTEPEVLRAALEAHVRKMVSHYRGRIHAWDVVNDAVDWTGAMRPSLLLDKLGPGYVADAFHWAHSEDPDALLIYNDYAMCWLNEKADGVLSMLTDLVNSGVPIHGVGFQMHVDVRNLPRPMKLQQNWQRFAALGLRINVSELDIPMAEEKEATIEQDLQLQKQAFRNVFRVCVETPACDSVTTWGVTDRYTWVTGFEGHDGPLLFTKDYEPKPAFYGAMQALVDEDTSEWYAWP